MERISSGSKIELEKVCKTLIDPLAIELAKSIKWIYLKNISQTSTELYPVAVIGKGKPILLLHGFDSCFMEFRKLVPYLAKKHQLIIPDLFGFGFCPRPKSITYGLQPLVSHLSSILSKFTQKEPIGVIGASMGGAIAMELARRHSTKINRLLLLSPAGLTGRPMPVPRPLDQLGVWFLKQKFVRRSLCKQAFADPNRDVGPPEEEIASLHLNNPGWGRSLAEFARSGGIANCGEPLPRQPLHVLWGKQDKILSKAQKNESIALLGNNIEELENCGHLPHLDCPNIVAERWLRKV